MDWILKLIKQYTAEDGSVDQEAIASALNAEAPKYVVPKAKYNELSNKLKEANDTIESLGENNNSELTQQLEEMATAYEQQAIYYAKRDALTEAGVAKDDLEFIMWKLGDDFELNEAGEVEGVSEAVKTIQETNAKYFSAAPAAGEGKTGEAGKTEAPEGKQPKEGEAGWKPIDNKLESGKAPGEKAPATLREAIGEYYSTPAD